MNKQQIKASLYQYVLILILLTALAYRGGREFLFHKNEVEVSVSLKNIQDIYPSAVKYTENRHGVFNVYADNSSKIGSVLLSSNYSQQFGYAGRVPLLIGIDDNLTITKIVLLPNKETGDYIEAIYGKTFIDRWQGINLKDAVNFDVDVVSGATLTSNAVIGGIKDTASTLVGVDTSAIVDTNLESQIKDVLFLSIMLLSLVMAYKKGMAKYRLIYLLFVLIILGLILNNVLSVNLLNSWLLSGFVWQTNWQTSVIFILALLVSFVGKRKFYCNYLCPMGALQELTNHVTPFKKKKFPAKLKGIEVREVYLVLIAGSLLLGFVPNLSYFEPFMFFSFRIIGYGLIMFGLVIIGLSLFFNKPWCSVCPTGCFMDLVSYKKVKNIDS